MCDADAEFGVSVAIGNGHIYDLVGCGGNADLRPTEAPEPASGVRSLPSTVYTVYVADDGRDEHARLVAPTSATFNFRVK